MGSVSFLGEIRTFLGTIRKRIHLDPYLHRRRVNGKIRTREGTAVKRDCCWGQWRLFKLYAIKQSTHHATNKTPLFFPQLTAFLNPVFILLYFLFTFSFVIFSLSWLFGKSFIAVSGKASINLIRMSSYFDKTVPQSSPFYILAAL